MSGLYRVCVKLYTDAADVADELFVPIFHEWIRERALDLVAIDVADYSHVPTSPGVMLVAHEVSIALDRGDGRFGLLVQRRRPVEGANTTRAIATTLGHALTVATRLEADRRVAGRLSFDRHDFRVEANDRLRAPNTDAAYERFTPFVRAAVAEVLGDTAVEVERVRNDPRDRLAVDVRVAAA